MRLNGQQVSELSQLARNRGLWSRVEPNNCDTDLHQYIVNGLVRHLGTGLGYEITDKGIRAIERSRP